MRVFKPLVFVLACAAGSVPGALVAAQLDRAGVERFVNDRTAKHQQRRDVAVARVRQMGFPVRRRLAGGKVIEVKRLVNGRPVYYTTDNENAADTISSDELWSGGSLGLNLDGTGQIFGIWDGGNVLSTHQEVTGRVTKVETVGNDSHSTHVGGTMIASGVATGARGMASAATLRSWDFGNDEVEMALEQLSANAVMVSNHSYSFITGWTDAYLGSHPCGWVWFGDVALSSSEDQLFGFYDESSKDWDQIAYNSPNYLMVKSAGNDRNDPGPSSGTRHCHYNSNGNSGPGFYYSSDSHPQDGGVTGYDTIAGGSASAKNIITVGATYDINGGYSTAGGVSLATFSGAGPTDDGRIKPDIVANGISLYSSTAGNDSQYGNYSGTSMSSPNVAGSLGLLGQHAENLYGTGFRFRAATHKALILHTADEAGASAGPDYMYGWGLMNTSRAAQLMTADANSSGPGNLYELQLNNSEEISIIVYSDGLSPLKATIAWTDPPGTPPANVVDPTTLMLVNDLDLRISNNSSTVFQPWVLQPASPASAATTGDNFRDNIEQVVVASPTEGWYLMTINHKGTLKDSSAQAFSVVVSGNVVLPLDLDLDSIPNTFEEDYGLDPLDPNDALLDPDNDGLTNLEEFELETDPGDPDSDDDLIIDGLDRLPNFDDALDTCTSPDAGLSIPIFNTVTCAASHSITTEGIAGVGGNETDGYGDLLMISPVVNFTPGFYVVPGGTLSVISENPNPLP